MSLGVLFKVQPPGASADTPPRLLFDGARIPRDTFRAMRRADEMLREAEAASAQLLQQSAATIAAHRQQAWERGFARGRSDAIVAVLGTLEVDRRLRERLSHRLADIVEHCVRSVIGERGEAPLMRERVLHLLRTAGMDRAAAPANATATLYVSPADLDAARWIAAEFSQGTGGTFAGLSVIADERRAPGALLLETPSGFVESSLQLTLDETRALLQQALAHALQALGETA